MTEGPLGVGKTSLTTLLAEELGARLVLEQAEDNPFLTDFYKDPARYRFQTQMFFLLNRFSQQQEMAQPDLFTRITISDYLFDKDRIFAYLNLDDHELSLYEQIYKILEPKIVRPDLVIFLQADTDTLLRRIKQRGRTFEKEIGPRLHRRGERSLQSVFLPLCRHAAPRHQYLGHRLRPPPGRP